MFVFVRDGFLSTASGFTLAKMCSGEVMYLSWFVCLRSGLHKSCERMFMKCWRRLGFGDVLGLEIVS